MEKDQAFVEYIVRALVKNPEAVRTERRLDEMGVLISLHVHPHDMGTIIGRQGRHAAALRLLVKILGVQNRARVHLQVLEPGQGDTARDETRIVIPEMRQSGPEEDKDDEESLAGHNLAPAVPLPALPESHHGAPKSSGRGRSGVVKSVPKGAQGKTAKARKARVETPSVPQAPIEPPVPLPATVAGVVPSSVITTPATPTPQAPEDTPVSAIGLPPRVVKVLERHNMSRIVHVVFHTPQGLIMTPGLTGYDVEIIAGTLARLGYTLGKHKKPVKALASAS